MNGSAFTAEATKSGENVQTDDETDDGQRKSDYCKPFQEIV